MIENNSILLEAFPGPAGVISITGEILMANKELEEFGVYPGMNIINSLPQHFLEIYRQVLAELDKKSKTENFPKLYKEIDYKNYFYVVYIGMQYGKIIFYAYNETKVRQTTDSLFRDASIDPLTGLLNRRRFIREVEQYNFPSGYTPFLIFFDIDHFKRVNDTFGHDAGDEVLKSVAKTARSVLRVGDVLARAGGEEFLVFSCCKDIANANLLGERLRTAIENKVVTANVQGTQTEIPVTISVGIDLGYKPINELISNADVALYVSKKTGRNKTTIFSKEMQKQ